MANADASAPTESFTLKGDGIGLQSNDGSSSAPSPDQPDNTPTATQLVENQQEENINQMADMVDFPAWTFMLSQLARQLEYYLSLQNLSKDTYVQTLRSLNDGCVPISILANFTKVKHILMSTVGPVDDASRERAVWEAATEHSTKLRCANIDAKTGKEVPSVEQEDEEEAKRSSFNTILAIGTMDNQPIAVLEPPVSAPASEFANALVLRDVAPQVAVEDIHALFRYEGCPPIISITPDVAQCWFVQFETTSRADVMAVLVQLRGETLAGFPVHARIKSSVAGSTVPIDLAPVPVPAEWHMEQPQQQSSKKNQNSPGQQNRRKKNRDKKKKKKNGSGNNGNNNNGKGNNNDNGNNNNNNNARGSNNNNSNNANNNSGNNSSTTTTPVSTPAKKKSIAQPPPSLGEDDFPTLLDNRVEWETTPVQDEAASDKEQNAADSEDNDKTEEEEEADYGIKSVKIGSDSASTATTTSSSTEPGPKKVGYAAALTKSGNSSSTSSISSNSNAPVAPPLKTTEDTPESPSPKTTTTTPVTEDIAPASPVVVTPPTWGSGRSFADAVRHAQMAA